MMCVIFSDLFFQPLVFPLSPWSGSDGASKKPKEMVTSKGDAKLPRKGAFGVNLVPTYSFPGKTNRGEDLKLPPVFLGGGNSKHFLFSSRTLQK